MFRVRRAESDSTLRIAVVAVMALSASALAVTVWVMVDFLAEQQIVHELIEELPASARSKAEALEGELKWQFRLSMLIVLNLIVTGFAVVLLSRAYRSSRASLRDVKALAGDILSSMDQAVITTDLDGVITSINRRGLEMLSQNSECVGRALAELSGTIDIESFRRQWVTAESAQMTQDFSAPLDGNERVLRAFCQLLSDIDENDIGYVLQLRDVTERLLIEDRVRRMERYLGLGSLAAGLHHEIKNPLAALSLHVQLLEEQLECDQGSDEVLQMLGVIKTEVTRIGGVLEGFRDFAAIGQLNLSEVDLRDLIQRQLDLIQPQADQQSVTIERCTSDDLPNVAVDRIRFEQVLLNIFVNAIEAMPDGGTLTVSSSTTLESVCVEIADTGSGVSEDLRDKIFDPYFTTKSEGTGLGLALCEKIMRQHGGSLDFRSSSRGTVFRLTTPKRHPDRADHKD